MIKVWCAKCEGLRETQINDGSGLGAVSTKCYMCEGKGYLEYEGSIGDVEIYRLWRNLQKQKAAVK